MCETAQSSCLSCNAGFGLDKKGACRPKCVCVNGRAAGAGSRQCAKPGQHSCVKCAMGWHLADGEGLLVTLSKPVAGLQCIMNQCTCPNGFPAPSCFRHGSISCLACRAGYHRTAKRHCALNVCRCTGGFPAVGPECPAHGMGRCVFCKNRFYLSRAKKCERMKKCECPNGVSASPSSGCSEKFNFMKCRKCNPGFHLVGTGVLQKSKFRASFCRVNKCRCPHGHATRGANCGRHGEVGCLSCSAGYELASLAELGRTGFFCKPICTCRYGLPETGSRCMLYVVRG